MDNTRWENKLRDMMGTKQGGVARSPSPGSQGNVAYAPGMMQYSQLSTPSSLALRDLNLGPSQNPNSAPSSPTSGTPSAGQANPGHSTGGMDPAVARLMMDRIMNALNKNLMRTGRLRAPTY